MGKDKLPDLFAKGLFDDDWPTEAYARSDDPSTSHDAARKVALSNRERMVYSAMCAMGQRVTSLCITRYLQKEMAERGDNLGWSVSPRLRPLERKGLVETDGEMAVLNSSGNIAPLTAWRVKKGKFEIVATKRKSKKQPKDKE